MTKKAKIIAICFGFALTGCLIGGLYLAGVFSKAPELAEALEGNDRFWCCRPENELFPVSIVFPCVTAVSVVKLMYCSSSWKIV